jgi:hypothetical protein
MERALPGMPAYEFLGEFVTALIPVIGGKGTSEHNSQATIAELTDFINAENQLRQFAPHLTNEELRALSGLGLQQSDFLIRREGGRIAGCAALWDQRSFKQTLIRGYAPWLNRFRPVINTFNRVNGQPQLPEPGAILSSAFACHLSARPCRSNLFANLIRSLGQEASRRGLQFLTLGLAANDPRLSDVRRQFCFREYRSRIYVVRWQRIGGAAKELDARVLGPEVALL